MKAMTDTAVDRSSAYARLDAMHISEEERRLAKASLRQGELIAELLLRAVADARAITQGVEHAAVSLANGVKTLFARSVER